jgi:arylsulfatase A-like enzyme
VIFILALTAALAAGGEARAAGEAAADVVLISIDDLRADRVRPDLMPNLTALAREGVSFSAAYSQASWTLPSHASLLLSQYPWTHGAGGFNALSPRKCFARAPSHAVRNLAQALKGYDAASFANCWFFQPEFGLIEGFTRHRVLELVDDPLPGAFDWLLSTGSTPRFLFAHTYAVHNYVAALDSPRDASGAWRCPLKVDPRGRRGDENVAPVTCAEAPVYYDRAAFCLDAELGLLFARLKASGRWDHTLVTVVSDHGEGLCDGPPPGRRWHNDLGYEQQLRVPWILKLPAGRLAGRTVAAPVALIDVAPTILSAVGLPPEPRFEGRDRLPEAAGEASLPEAPIFADTDRGLAVRAGRWKLLRGRDGQAELYDLSEDPGESVNLAASRPDEFRALEALLREHAGRQRAGWRAAVRGRAGARFTLKVRSDRPLVMVIPIFVEKGDPGVRVSTDGLTVEAEFVSQFDGDEDWLVFEASAYSARVTLEAFEDGRPIAGPRARLGPGAGPGPLPWTLSRPQSRKRAEASSVPSPADGLRVWRGAPPGAATADASPRPVRLDPRTLEALREAGYLR